MGKGGAYELNYSSDIDLIVFFDRARAWLGATMVYRGRPLPFDEARASDELRGATVQLRVDLGAGRASATAWGCDMTPEYVHINSDYTT